MDEKLVRDACPFFLCLCLWQLVVPGAEDLSYIR